MSNGICVLERESSTILEIVGQLVNHQLQELTESQQYAINRIYLYTQELFEILHNHSLKDAKIHRQAIDLVTPILGYAQMLAEGWMGIMTGSLHAPLTQVAEHATRMRQELLRPVHSDVVQADSVILYADNI